MNWLRSITAKISQLVGITPKSKSITSTEFELPSAQEMADFITANFTYDRSCRDIVNKKGCYNTTADIYRMVKLNYTADKIAGLQRDIEKLKKEPF